MSAPDSRPLSALLTDFGLAKAIATGSKYTRTGQALGTPAYMSPEQARGDVDLTAATDVWSLGCILYELLAGRQAFEGDTPAAVIGAVVGSGPPSLATLRPDVPAEVAHLVQSCLSKFAGHRLPSARELRNDLCLVLQGERPQARGARARRRAPLAAAVVVVVAVAASAAVAIWRGSPARDPGPPVPAASPGEGLAFRALAIRRTDAREAARLLGEALAVAPTRDDWRVERGLLLWAIREGPAARAEWGRVAPGSTHEPRARLYRGLEAYFRFATDDALPDIRAAARGTGPEARLAHAALAAGTQRYAEALTTLAGMPGWEAALLRAVVVDKGPARDHAAALRAYDEALAEGVALAWVLHSRGLKHHFLGDYPRALADYDAALQIARDDGHTHASRGAALHALERLPEALAAYDEALRLDPGFAEALYDRGVAKRDLGDLLGAITDFDAYLGRHPDHADALCHRGVVYANLGRFAEALADLDAADRADPGQADILRNRARVHDALGNLPEALADFDAALRLQPDDPVAWQGRGVTKYRLSDFPGAIADLAAAVRLEPTDADAHANLGLARRALGDWAGAAAALREAVRLTPAEQQSPDFRQLLAECEAKMPGG